MLTVFCHQVRLIDVFRGQIVGIRTSESAGGNALDEEAARCGRHWNKRGG